MAASAIALAAETLGSLAGFVGSLRREFLCRIGGAPVERIHSLRDEPLWEFVSRLLRVEAKLELERHVISATLHKLIGATADDVQRRSMIRCRRNLFNLKRLSLDEVAAVRQATTPNDRERIEDFCALMDERGVLVRTLETAYADGLARVRTAFRHVTADHAFEAGLALSSESLCKNLDAYRSGRLSGASRVSQIERGLLRYFSRMAMKATPFSQFCVVVAGTVVAPHSKDERGLRLEGDMGSRRGAIRLNKKLFSVVWNYLRTRPEVKGRLLVELNSTLTCGDTHVRFLAARDGFEVFQTVRRNPAIDLLIDRLREKRGQSLASVARLLSESSEIECTLEESESYVTELAKVGLFAMKGVVRDQDPDWDVPLAEFLEGLDDPEAQTVASMLREARVVAERISSPHLRTRAEELSRLSSLIREGVGALGLRLFRDAGLPMLEDVTANARARLVLSPATKGALQELAQYLRFAKPMARPYREQATMRAYFDRKYPSGADVPLLQFYEDYYRDHLKDHLQRATPGFVPSGANYDARNPFNVPRIDELDRRTAELRDLILSRWRASPGAEEIRVSLATLDTGGSLDEADECEPAMVSLFCLVGEARGRGIVCAPGGMFNLGYGKYFSRFLYLADDALTKAVRTTNTADHSITLAEIADDAGHNANFHPPLVDAEIAYPLTESPSRAAALDVSALIVRRHPNAPNALVLVCKATEKRVIPLDLGFLNPRLRPPLYQLLRAFSPIAWFGCSLPSSLPAPASGASAPPRVSYRPRIVFENSVVLHRRAWVVPLECLPKPSSKSDAEYFVQVNRWRATMGMPDEVFVRVVALPASRTAAAPSEPAATRALAETVPEVEPPRDLDENGPEDDAAHLPEPTSETPNRVPEHRPSRVRNLAKPQYIDFRNPLFAQLFQRAAGPLQAANIIVEERLLGDDALPSLGGERWVTELCLEFEL